VERINTESNSVQSRIRRPQCSTTLSVFVLLLLQIVLFLTAVGSLTGQYHVYEEGENEEGVGNESPASLTGASFEGARGIAGYGGAGTYAQHPSVQYVTPHVNSYGELTGTNYYDPGDHTSVRYGGAIAEGHGDLSGRVRVQVRLKETQHLDNAQY